MSGERETCERCGAVLPKVTITYSTIPAEVVVFCPYCPGEEAKWAEHFDGDILRMPTVRLDGGAAE